MRCGRAQQKRCGWRDDRGSGSVLAVAIVGAVVVVALAAMAATSAFAARQAAVGAADAAALAAADVRLGVVGGEACEVAARVAAANRASLVSCSARGAVVTVQVQAEVLGASVRVASRAGPHPRRAPRRDASGRRLPRRAAYHRGMIAQVRIGPVGGPPGRGRTGA